MKEVRDVTRKFFQLPYEEKLKIKMTPQSGYRCGCSNMPFSCCSRICGPCKLSNGLFSEGIKG